MKRMNLIERQALADEIRSLRMTTTKIQVGEAVFTAENARDFRDNVLRIIDEQPAVEPAHQTAGEMFRERGYYPKKSADNMTEYTDGEWSFKATKDGGFELWANYNGLKVSQKTILACARLIEELEGEKENGKS